MTRWRGRISQVAAAGAAAVGVATALGLLGLPPVHVVAGAVLAAAVVVGIALQIGLLDRPWEASRLEVAGGARDEVSHLSWQVRTRDGRVHPRVLLRVQQLVTVRLARDGTVVDPADMVPQRADVVATLTQALGARAARALCGGPRELPDAAALGRVLDALDALDASDASGAAGSRDSAPVSEPLAPHPHRKDSQ